LYDGHGSTRQLADNTGSLITGQAFNYDAYGNMLGTPNPNTNLLYTGEWYDPDPSLLYSGEHFDTDMQQYNLRARWYNQNNGRFNRMDPFAGNTRDPQSLHKYAYCHNNSVNNIDPSGKYSFGEVVSVLSIISTLICLLAPPFVGMGGAMIYEENKWKPWDAFVVSASLSVMSSLFGFLQFGMGAGMEFTYDLLYIRSLGRWQDYWSWGGSIGARGVAGTLEAGEVWNVKEVEHYEGFFMSSTFGGACPTGPVSVGGAMTYFWNPIPIRGTRKHVGGYKVGIAASSSTWMSQGTFSSYNTGGPFTWCRNILDHFNNNNFVPPESGNMQEIIDFLEEIRESIDL
jgi:RHS repeat-associated protein